LLIKLGSTTGFLIREVAKEEKLQTKFNLTTDAYGEIKMRKAEKKRITNYSYDHEMPIL